MVVPVQKDGRKGKIPTKGYKLSFVRWTSSQDLMYSMMTTVNKNGLYTWNLVRGQMKYSHHTCTQKLLAVWGDGHTN